MSPPAARKISGSVRRIRADQKGRTYERSTTSSCPAPVVFPHRYQNPFRDILSEGEPVYLERSRFERT
jgi:hypothetical protein